ncbi:MAG TPA: methyl-accepting chemotaxis protein [Baekduia sp.]|nr:methyl-accepting chemotaxis protein [Baekduia sp.]
MRHRRITIQTKLLASAGLLLALTGLIGMLSISKLSGVDGRAQTNFTHGTVPLEKLGEARALINENRVLGVRYLIDPPARGALTKKITANTKIIQRDLAAVQPTLSTPEAKKTFAAIQSDLTLFRARRSEAFRRADTGSDQAAYAWWTANAVPVAQSAVDAFKSLFDDTLAVADAGNRAITDAYTSARTLIIVTLLIALALGAATSLMLARSIRGNVAQVLDRISSLRDHCATGLENALGALARGDLTVEVEAVTTPIESYSNDEVGDVAAATNSIRDKLAGSIDAYNNARSSLAAMVGQVAGTATTVSSASQQMAATSQEAGRAVGEIANAMGEVASGAQRQVDGIETARRLGEEVVQATDRSAADAVATAQATEDARRIATEGATAVAQATDAMASVLSASTEATEAIRQLGAKSQAIGSIVATITGIAEQTNLLALNAAIEAARAGEQGRGFAVVAEEVRKLAEESQKAAGSIASLIGEIQAETGRAVEVVEDGATRTEQGAATVELARDAFQRIGGSVEDVTDRVSQIAAAVKQIAASAVQMGASMADVAAVAEESSASTEEVSASTEQTSASTQQIAASADELARTAAELEQLVAGFTLA